MAEYTVDDARAFIASARWRYAWTYRKFAPHWYTRREDASDRDAWTAFARYVWENGVPMHWKGGTTMVSRYTDIGEFMYWCGSADEDVQVNKARITSPDVRVRA
jgi:hypothetical protein